MTKRKILLLAMSLCMVAILAVGGTLAYFTDSDADHNVLTVGNIKIDQVEDFPNDKPLMPGKDGSEAMKKVVNVKNEGTNPVYIRTLFAFEDTQDLCTAVHYNSHYYQDFIFPFVDNDYLQFKAADGTVFTVGYVVYPAEIRAGGVTSNPLLAAVWVDETANNEWREICGDEYEVLVLTQAVQADGWAEGTTPAQALNETWGEITATADAEVAEWFELAVAGDNGYAPFDYSSYTVPMWYKITNDLDKDMLGTQKPAGGSAE